MIKTIIKSNGTSCQFDITRLNKWAEWADVHGICWEDVVDTAIKKCYDGCSTKELHTAMIAACIDKKDQQHADMAGRLLLGQIYKEAYGGFNHIPEFHEYYRRMVDSKHWVSMDKSYNAFDLVKIGEYISHAKDLTYGYSVLKQYKDKYCIADAVNNRTLESPQMLFMGMAMAVMEAQEPYRRLKDVFKLYDYLSDLKINAPTPYLNGLRATSKGYASCCVIKGGDSADSIGIAEHIAYIMTCKQAGIGMYLETRSTGDGVKNNTIVHQGKLPYYRCIDSAVKANKQFSRGGSATVFYRCIDPEIQDLLQLKNPMTPDQKRIPFMDYAVGVNSFFAKKAAKNEEWMLVSYKDAPELHNSMCTMDFEEVYNKVAADNSIKKTYIKARRLLADILTQRVETGRIYLHWLDHANYHTPFKDPINSSNLCMEINLPTSEYNTMDELYGHSSDGTGEIALCFLASIVAGRVTKEEYEDVAYYTVLMIDNVMDLMDYPFPDLAHSASSRRSIGVGITNLAHYLASNFVSYSSIKGKNLVHELAELHSYSLHKASLKLAKERGVCDWMHKTKYPDGWLPIDTYSKAVDEVHTAKYKCDWEGLRAEIIENGGIRNSVLEAFMPNESSSLSTNTTNGLYPIRESMVFKKSSKGSVLFIAPEYDILKYSYDLAYNVPTKDLIDCYAIVQKFCGQGISADFYLDYNKLPDGKVSLAEQVNNFLYSTKMGLKSHYYLNSKVGVTENTNDIHCSGCSI